MRTLKYLVALLAALGLTLTVTPAAKAEPIPDVFGGGDVSVSFADFRYPGSSCYTHRGYLNVNANDEYAFDIFTVEIDMSVRASGQWVDGWYDYAEWGGSYSLDALLCRNIDGTGTFDVDGSVTFSGSVEYYDPGCECMLEEYHEETVYVHDSLVVRAPLTASVSKIAQARYGTHGWKVTAQAKYDGRAWAGKRIYFQRKISGSWRTITSKLANTYGRAAFAYTPPRGTAKPYRFYTSASSGVGARTSAVFYLKRR